MNRYLLLRDNKQSGPYSVAELVQKGIKAYDLVWLDGKSAAWRYPSEIEELKAYAPAVEEQPYDRFYKKPSLQQSFQRKEYFSEPAEVVLSGTIASISGASEVNNTDAYVRNTSIKPETSPVVQQLPATSPAEQLPVEIPAIQNDQPRKIYVNLPGTAAKSAAKPIAGETAQPRPAVKPAHTIVEKTEESSSGVRQKALPVEAVNKTSLDDGNISVQESEDPRQSKKTGIPFQPADPALEAYAPVPAERIPFPSDDEAAGSGWPDQNSAAKRPVLSGRKSGTKNKNNSPAGETFASFSERLSAKLSQKTYSSRTIGASHADEQGSTPYAEPSGRTRMVMTAIVAVCLLLGGVIIGLAISNSKNESQAELDRLVKQIQDRQSANNTASVVPASASTSVVQNPETVPVQQPVESQPEPVAEKPQRPRQVVSDPPVTNSRQPATPAPDEQVVKNVPKTALPTPAETTSAKKENSANAVEAEETRKNIRQLVSLQNNKYKTGVLGGISDLELTIANKSAYELDVVEVEVAYLGPERKVIRTQTIVFNNVKAGKTSVQEVPKSSRGVSVTTSIKSIQSKSLGLGYSGL